MSPPAKSDSVRTGLAGPGLIAETALQFASDSTFAANCLEGLSLPAPVRVELSTSTVRYAVAVRSPIPPAPSDQPPLDERIEARMEATVLDLRLVVRLEPLRNSVSEDLHGTGYGNGHE